MSPVRRPDGRVFCAEPEPGHEPGRSCTAHDLFLVAEGTQCGNCLAVNGKPLAQAIAERAERSEP